MSDESRNVKILENMLGADNEILPPFSRVETLLIQLMNELQSGGGSVVVDSQLSTTSTNPIENKAVASQMMGVIAGFAVSASSGSMEVWSGDMNNLTKSGFYNCLTCKNAPGQYLAVIVVGYYLTGYCIQIAFDVTTGNIQKRAQINGTWSAWGDFAAYTDATNKNY